jgi:hypothetical protein
MDLVSAIGLTVVKTRFDFYWIEIEQRRRVFWEKVRLIRLGRETGHC